MYENFWDEDDGTALNPKEVHLGMDREFQLANELNVFERHKRKDVVKAGHKIEPTRWCFRKGKTGEEVRARWVAMQFKIAGLDDVFAGTPSEAAIRMIMAIALAFNQCLLPGDFSVAFMHTPMGDEITYVEPMPGYEDSEYVWLLKKAIN